MGPVASEFFEEICPMNVRPENRSLVNIYCLDNYQYIGVTVTRYDDESIRISRADYQGFNPWIQRSSIKAIHPFFGKNAISGGTPGAIPVSEELAEQLG